MCFFVHPEQFESKTAEQDISCFKILRCDNNVTDLFSPIKKHPYTLGKEETSPIGKMYENPQTIEEGLHSCSSMESALGWVVPYDHRMLFDATIPKGSMYFHNPDRHEYVSDRLTVNKPIQ